MKFKRGDIVYWMGSDKAFGIVIGDCEYYKGCYRLYANGSYDTHSSCSGKNLRHATDDEKELLITALAKENKYYCEKTKTIKEMKKEDLKSGMWVELRNGDRYMVIKDCETASAGKQCFCLSANDGYLISDEYTDCLTCSYSEYNEFDICAVYSTNGDAVSAKTYTGEYMSLVWRRNDNQQKIKDKIDEMQRIIDELKADLR